MKTISILFSTQMVQAILEGRKTQTRRVIKKQPDLSKHTHISRAVILDGTNTEVFNYHTGRSINVESVKCPYGQPGYILWVRETHYAWGHWTSISEDGKTTWEFQDLTLFEDKEYHYETNPPEKVMKGRLGVGYYKRPAIFMPKEACRLFLKVKSVRVERLQDISEDDAIAEGVEQIADYGSTGYKLYTEPEAAYSDIDALYSFESLWQSINGEQSWNDNPWVRFLLIPQYAS